MDTQEVPTTKAVGITRHPLILAIWPATEPVAPAAPDTTTVSPALTGPTSVIPKYAVRPGGKEKRDWFVNEAHFDGAFDYKSEDLRARLSALCPKGIDVFFDNVGGAILNEVLARINLNARIALCGSNSIYDASVPQPGPAN